MSKNINLKHRQYIAGPNCHPSCLIKPQKSRGATKANKEGWFTCAKKYGGDVSFITKYEPTNDEKERLKETQFQIPPESLDTCHMMTCTGAPWKFQLFHGGIRVQILNETNHNPDQSTRRFC